MLPGDYDELPGLSTMRAMHPLPRCPTPGEGQLLRQCTLYPGAPPAGRVSTAPWGRISLSSPSCPPCSGLGLTLGPEAPSPDSHHKETPRVWGKECL